MIKIDNTIGYNRAVLRSVLSILLFIFVYICVAFIGLSITVLSVIIALIFVHYKPTGVELILGERVLSIAWNAEKELFDVSTTSIKSLLGNFDYYQIEAADLPIDQNIIGSKLTAIKPRCNWHYDIDDELEPIDPTQHILNEVILSFENEHQFQIATITYSIQNKSIHQPMFDSQGELLLSLDRILEINSAI